MSFGLSHGDVIGMIGLVQDPIGFASKIRKWLVLHPTALEQLEASLERLRANIKQHDLSTPSPRYHQPIYSSSVSAPSSVTTHSWGDSITDSCPRAFSYSQATHEKKELPVVINGVTVAARYDTMAEGNIISKALAKRLDLDIHHSKTGDGTFVLANGKKVSSIGLVNTHCAFLLDPGVEVDTKFWVWDNVVGSGLILGRAFLKATKILSTFRHRLRACTSSWTIPFLNKISSDVPTYSERLLCMIDNEPMYISPDTGSDLDVMSLHHALRKGYTIDTSVRRKVALGDGTIVVTTGQVSNIHVSLGGQSYYRTFDILANMNSNIILGETTLEVLEAYTMHERYFSDLELGQRDLDMSTIVDLGRLGEWLATRRVGREQKKGRNVENCPNDEVNDNTVASQENASLARWIETMDMCELCRQDKADKFILALYRSDPAAAIRAGEIESDKRRKYEIERQRLLSQIPSVGSINIS